MSDYSLWESAVTSLDNNLPDCFPISEEVFDGFLKKVEEDSKDLENQLLFLKRINIECVEKKSAKNIELTGNVSSIIDEINEVSDKVVDHMYANFNHYTELNNILKKVKDVDKCSNYFYCIAELEELSSFIQSAMLIENMDQAVDHFRSLVSLAESTKYTKCIHLCNYMQSMVAYWYKIILDSLSGEMEQIFPKFGWPIVSTSFDPDSAVKENVGTLIKYFMKIELPHFLSIKVDQVFKSEKKHTICLPMQFFLAPFKTRFYYHFVRDAQTNDIEKPEWYFTQVLVYVKDHKSFIIDKLQEIFNKAGYSQICVLHEFVEGLVLMVSDKLRTDLTKLMEGHHVNVNQLIAHHIEEALLFHAEISSTLMNPDSFHGCLDVLIEKDIFNKWLSIEKEYALKKMDDMFSMKDAWMVQTAISLNNDNDNDDINDRKLPQFAELFFMLMATIQDRYALLPSADFQLEFCELQLYLIDDFRIRLFQIRKQVFSDMSQLAENKKYFTILNTVAFVVEFLKKWSDDLFYIKLSYHKVKLEKMDKHIHLLEEGFKLAERNKESQGGSDIVNSLVEPSIFDNMIELYERMMAEMMGTVSNFIFRDFEEKCKPYIRDKWLALPSHKEFLSLTLSNSACPMLRCLKIHLEEMEVLLNKSLFTSLWQKMTQLIDDHIFENVICVNRFNEGGAMQINFDMNRNLFPLFLRYSNKPENFFKSVKEACIILTLAPGSALLIRDVIRRALHPLETTLEVSDPVSALHDVKVYKLHLEQVELILSLRMDLQTF